MKSLIAFLFVAPSVGQAALTLTVNTATKTLSWSGSATSPVIVGPNSTQTNIGITTGVSNTYNGGTFATSAVSSGPGLSMTVVSGITAITPVDDPEVGVVWSNTTTGTGGPIVSSLIGTIFFFGGVNETTFTVTANTDGGGAALSYDYSNLGAAEEALLESQDGVRLFFSDTAAGSDLGDAGVISVVSVPEPHTVTLGVFGMIGLALRRNRRS